MAVLASPSVVAIGACQGCGACLLTCPEHAIRPAGGTLVVLAQRCSGCGECIEVCPVDAITETDVAPPPTPSAGGGAAGGHQGSGGGTAR